MKPVLYRYNDTESVVRAMDGYTPGEGWGPLFEAPEPCKWTLDDDESNTWASGCGELWSFIDGGPAENRVKYCHGCGKPVVLEDKP